MQDPVRRRLDGIRAILMAHHAAGMSLPSATKGTEREVLVREFLGKVFPAPYRFGSGAVTDASGRRSGQLDIVVEWPFCASFPAPSGTERLYLAESVAFVVEVKSNLASQWDQVERSAARVHALRRHWAGHAATGAPMAAVTPQPPSVSWIPFVAVGFVGFKTLSGLKKRLARTPGGRRPDAALVIDSGAYVGWANKSSVAAKGFFLFCDDASFFVRNVVTAEPILANYTR